MKSYFRSKLGNGKDAEFSLAQSIINRLTPKLLATLLTIFLLLMASVLVYAVFEGNNISIGKEGIQIGPGELSRPPSIVPMPINYQEVSTLLEPDYKDVHFLKDVRIIDLRSHRLVPENKKNEKYSPVTWSRYSLVEKISESDSPLVFEFGTTGIDLSPRSLTHEFQLVKSTGPHFHGKTDLKITWHVQVDVTEEKPFSPFLVITEATYWNAFNGKEKEWAGMVAQENTKTDEIAMIILFPKKRTFTNLTRYGYKHKEKDRKQFRGSDTVIPSKNGQVLLWRIKDPKPGYVYEAHWDWKIAS